MAKFNVGDKVKVVRAGLDTYWYSNAIGLEYTLAERYNSSKWYIKTGEGGVSVMALDENDIELVQAKPKFDMKTMPWIIEVDGMTKAEKQAVIEFIDSQYGCHQPLPAGPSVTFYANVNSIGEFKTVPFYSVSAGECRDLIRKNTKQILVTFETKVEVKSVEYPKEETPEQIEAKRIREEIKRLSEEIVKLAGNLNKLESK